MLKSTLFGAEEKAQVWQASKEADVDDISFEEFRVRVLTAVEPFGVVSTAVHQELSHNGLCIRGGIVEKCLTRLKLID